MSPTTSCLFRIVGLHFAEQAGWGDPTAWPIRTAANPAARSRSNAGTGAFSNADSRSAAGAAAKAAAARILTRGYLVEEAGAVARVSRRSDDRSNQRRERFRGQRLERFSRRGNRHRRLGWIAPGHRAGDWFVALALGLGRRRRVPSAAATTTATWARRRQKYEPRRSEQASVVRLGCRGWGQAKRDQQNAEKAEME